MGEYVILKDISIQASWKKPWDKTRGRAYSKATRSKQRKDRLEKDGGLLFINETYFGYNKDNKGLWNIVHNRWNDLKYPFGKKKNKEQVRDNSPQVPEEKEKD